MNRPIRTLSSQEKHDWLRLIRSENVGPITFFRLLERFGSAGGALKALPELARRGGRARPIALGGEGDAERELEAAAKVGARLVAWGEPEYPSLLAEIEDAPPLIYVRGHATLFAKPAVAIVGARNASLNGQRLARSFAVDLGVAGLVVVSGLARGIDAAAHAGALATGTVAVVAGGIDVVYPEDNRRLHDEIAGAGALVSEMPPGTVPQGRHFPRRNRLISGMVQGVVVVEASPRSGSLITARLALAQGREVFAVPGSPLDPRARGTNALIRDGAALTESADDVLRGLIGFRRPLGEGEKAPIAPPSAAVPDEAELDSARAAIAGLLGPSPVTVDEIVRNGHFSPAVVSLILLELELAGRLERHPGHQVSLVGPLGE